MKREEPWTKFADVILECGICTSAAMRDSFELRLRASNVGRHSLTTSLEDEISRQNGKH